MASSKKNVDACQSKSPVCKLACYAIMLIFLAFQVNIL